MKTRCYRKTWPGFKHYGGRGIKVCDRWLESFENFLADMGRRPSSDHSLDREDNEKDYCLANCRWATKIEQQNNKRTNVFLELDGERMTLSDWGRHLGMAANTIRMRLVNGWSIADALQTRVK